MSCVSPERPLLAVFHSGLRTIPDVKIGPTVPMLATGQHHRPNREIGLKRSPECPTRDQHCRTIASTRPARSDFRLEGESARSSGDPTGDRQSNERNRDERKPERAVLWAGD
jgi:hypothetical protein